MNNIWNVCKVDDPGTCTSAVTNVSERTCLGVRVAYEGICTIGMLTSTHQVNAVNTHTCTVY